MSQQMLMAAARQLAGGGGGGGHRYWRINITANDGDASFVGLLEAEFRAEHLGPNLTGGGTASASSNATPYFASQAFDSNWADRSGLNKSWATNSTPTGWLRYDFGAPVTINEIMLWARGDGVNAHTQSPKDFDIQSSDDNAVWTTEWSVVGSTGWINFEGRVFTRPGYVRSYSGSPYGAHAWWRVQSIVFNGGAGGLVSASEIEFRNAAGADQASGGTAVASSNFDATHVPAGAFANDGGTTFWASANEGGCCWVGYHFPAPVEVKAVMYQARADSSANQSPKDFAIQFSDDGTHWSTAWVELGETGWGLGEIRVFTDPNWI